MRLFIFEHVSGGMAGEPLPQGLVAQGCAMRDAVARDLARLGHEVVIAHDPRLAPPPLGIEVHTVATASDLEATFDQLAAWADRTLVIAPECAGILPAWLERLARRGHAMLNAAPKAVRLCGDKLALAAHLHEAGIPTPRTARLGDPVGWIDNALAAGQPLIVKPRDGAGCDETFLCRDRAALDRPCMADEHERIVQAYVPGLAVSVSFVVGGDVIALPAGRQRIRINGECAEARLDKPTVAHGKQRLIYEGGSLPLDGALAERATALARAALQAVSGSPGVGGAEPGSVCEAPAPDFRPSFRVGPGYMPQAPVRALPGLCGFIGVDLILGNEPAEDCVIEINPRLTMSYIALSRLCQSNLAAALLDPEAPLYFADKPLIYDAAGRAILGAEATV